MDKAIVELAEAFKRELKTMGICIDQLCDILLDHEKRLQELEKPLDIAKELSYVKTFVDGLQDPEKRTAALAELCILCNVLGITDLEG
jgi:hypothetical protein